MLLKLVLTSTCLLALVTPALAQLPYNPTRLVVSEDKSKVYRFSPQGSQVSFSYFDISRQVYSSSSPVAFGEPLPFQSVGKAYIPIADDEGITILVGDCQDTTGQAALWRYKINEDGKSGTWSELDLGSSDTNLSTNYLSAGFSFSGNGSIEDTSLYIFGGMCPDGPSNTTTWTSEAAYSNTMLSISSTNNQPPYQLSVTGTRAPPIAEAGLTITPLSLVSTKSSAGQVSQQQNFVLLGGHTQNAFINMSQVALFSLPEASWAFIGVNQPDGTTGELVKREDVVEPRSGHTAVFTEDGSKIIVFGGWVGDVTNLATPQLAVLELGQGYGGTADWEWTVPKTTDDPLTASQGLYGHGAVILPGNVMMVAGGVTIGSPTQKRSIQNCMFYNVDTGAWSKTYKSTISPNSSSSGLDSSQKVGLGAGLGLGFTVVALIILVWWLYRRKLRERRAERERHLRELAFGSERFLSNSRVPSRLGGRYEQPDMRSASWGSRQEQQVESDTFNFPWSNQHNQNVLRESDDRQREVERTGMEVPSPTRGLRKNLSTRGPATYGNFTTPAPVTGPGSVFRIDEVEEEGSVKSMHVKTPAPSRISDPFKDPPHLEQNPAAEERKREVQGWVDDWQSAAVSMNLSRNPSQARTYSNLSQAQSHSESSSYKTGRESPEKSDRTGSNLSERSQFSLQKSTGTISRQLSQRSVSAGYTLFAGAAAAMGRIGGANRETALERAASKRSISLNTGPPRRTASGTQRPVSSESRSLLLDHSPTKSIGDDSPIKDYKNYARTSSLTSQRKKMGIFGSVKRVLTGTQSVDVQSQVEQYEEKVEEAQMTTQPEMSETPTAPAFWRGKRGAKDWDNNDHTYLPPPASSSTNPNKRRSTISSVEDYDGEDWDVETAVQKRVVQVMFTVPKEKLRVVNADALSLISRSDIDEREEKEERNGKAETRRMGSVREDDGDGSGHEKRKEKERISEREV